MFKKDFLSGKNSFRIGAGLLILSLILVLAFSLQAEAVDPEGVREYFELNREVQKQLNRLQDVEDLREERDQYEENVKEWAQEALGEISHFFGEYALREPMVKLTKSPHRIMFTGRDEHIWLEGGFSLGEHLPLKEGLGMAWLTGLDPYLISAIYGLQSQAEILEAPGTWELAQAYRDQLMAEVEYYDVLLELPLEMPVELPEEELPEEELPDEEIEEREAGAQDEELEEKEAGTQDKDLEEREAGAQDEQGEQQLYNFIKETMEAREEQAEEIPYFYDTAIEDYARLMSRIAGNPSKVQEPEYVTSLTGLGGWVTAPGEPMRVTVDGNVYSKSFLATLFHEYIHQVHLEMGAPLLHFQPLVEPSWMTQFKLRVAETATRLAEDKLVALYEKHQLEDDVLIEEWELYDERIKEGQERIAGIYEEGRELVEAGRQTEAEKFFLESSRKLKEKGHVGFRVNQATMAGYYQNRKLYGYVEDEITRMLRFMRDYTTIKEFIVITSDITSPRVLREKYERVKRDVEEDIVDGLSSNKSLRGNDSSRGDEGSSVDEGSRVYEDSRVYDGSWSYESSRGDDGPGGNDGAGNNYIVESPALEIDSRLYFSLARRSPEIVY